MKPAFFAVALNIAVFVVAMILVQMIPVLGAVACLFSYVSIGYLGYILAKYPVNIRVETADAIPRQEKQVRSGGKRQSRLRKMEE